MNLYLCTTHGYVPSTAPAASDALWLDCWAAQAQTASEFTASIEARTGLVLEPLHAQDALNALHPSHYDGTPQYDIVVFRSLLCHETRAVGKKKSRSLQTIATQPVSFIISDRCLITVQHGAAHSAASGATLGNALQLAAERVKTPCSPHELMLRFLNAQVDAYLALRQPLTEQLDRWQRELLDPRRSFNDWTALLDARLELRKLEALSEEQLDALQELREAWVEPQALPYSADEIASLRVRLSDVMEHIGRVLNHAKRLEDSVESAIQLHFASVSHATNKTVTQLTVMTAIFAPLTLLTGFYGMNVPLPWQAHPQAVYWILSGMGAIVGGMLFSLGVVRLWRHKRKGLSLN